MAKDRPNNGIYNFHNFILYMKVITSIFLFQRFTLLISLVFLKLITIITREINDLVSNSKSRDRTSSNAESECE